MTQIPEGEFTHMAEQAPWPTRICVFLTTSDAMVAQFGDGLMAYIQDELTQVGAHHDVQVTRASADWHCLLAELSSRRHDIVHIVGHADRDGAVSAEDVWGDVQVDKAAFSRALRAARTQLVILSTCFGGQVAEHLVEDGAVRVAIGADEELPLAAALSFARGFYRAIGSGCTIGDAVKQGQGWLLRFDGTHGQQRVIAADGAALQTAIVGRTRYLLFGNVCDESVVQRLLDALPGVAVHDVYSLMQPRSRFAGQHPFDVLQGRLEQAEIILHIFDPDASPSPWQRELVVRAVHRAHAGRARLLVIYPRGTSADVRLPFGLMQFPALFVEGPPFDGHIEKVAVHIERLRIMAS